MLLAFMAVAVGDLFVEAVDADRKYGECHRRVVVVLMFVLCVAQAAYILVSALQ